MEKANIYFKFILLYVRNNNNVTKRNYWVTLKLILTDK